MRSATLLAEIMGDLRANDTGVSRRAGHRARDEPRRVLEGDSGIPYRSAGTLA